MGYNIYFEWGVFVYCLLQVWFIITAAAEASPHPSMLEFPLDNYLNKIHFDHTGQVIKNLNSISSNLLWDAASKDWIVHQKYLKNMPYRNKTVFFFNDFFSIGLNDNKNPTKF